MILNIYHPSAKRTASARWLQTATGGTFRAPRVKNKVKRNKEDYYHSDHHEVKLLRKMLDPDTTAWPWGAKRLQTGLDWLYSRIDNFTPPRSYDVHDRHDHGLHKDEQQKSLQECLVKYKDRILGPSSPQAQRVQRVFEQLREKNPEELAFKKWKITTIDEDIHRQAVVYPGLEHIIVWTGIFEGSGADANLANIIAHELGHILCKQTKSSDLIWPHVLPVDECLLYLTRRMGHPESHSILRKLFVAMPVSRQYEYEADYVAQKLSHKAGFGCGDWIKRLEQEKRRWEWTQDLAGYDIGDRRLLQLLSTHPPHESRVARLRENMSEKRSLVSMRARKFDGIYALP